MIFNNMFVFHDLYINLDCLSVCLFVSNKRQNGWTDRAQILCRIYRWSDFKNLCLKVFYFCNFFLNLENPRIFF